MTDRLKEQFEKGIPERDQITSQMMIEEIRSNQNLLLGALGDVIAAAMGAGGWAIITAVTNYQIGWMAVGIGFLVGVAVRLCGKGMDKIFGIVGAVLSLLGCMAGNLFVVCILLSRQEHIPFLDLLSRLNPEIVVELMQATFSPMDVLFYGIAVYEGYRFSLKRVPTEALGKVPK
jgi:hypothetical protein